MREMLTRGKRMAALFHMMSLGVLESTRPERTKFEPRKMPLGEAPEDLRKPLLTGRHGKGTRKSRRA